MAARRNGRPVPDVDGTLRSGLAKVCSLARVSQANASASLTAHLRASSLSRWRTTPSRATACRRTLEPAQRDYLHGLVREVLGDAYLRGASPVCFTRVFAGILRREFPATARPAAPELVRDAEPVDEVAGANRRSPTTGLVCKRSGRDHNIFPPKPQRASYPRQQTGRDLKHILSTC